MTVRRAAAWSLASQYATFVIQFAASVIISRLFLLPAEVGLFSIALAAALMVAVFQDMGLTRFVSGQREMRPELVGDYAFVAVGIGWLVAGAVALAAPAMGDFYGEPRLTQLLWVIAASYIIVPFATVPAALLVRAMDFRSLFAVNAGSALGGNAVAIAMAAQGHGAASLAWGVLATAIVRTGLAMAFSPVRPRVPASYETVRPLLSFGSSSFVISASGAVGQRSQDLIVGRLLGLEATGLFSRAGALAGQLNSLITGAISTVFYSAFARKRDAGEPLAAPYLHLVSCNTALSWAAMIGLALVAEPLVVLLYGEAWAEVAPLLRWMAIGEMLFVAIPLQMDIPILLGRIRTLIWINLLDTTAAIATLAIACFYGVEEAAMSRIAYGIIWWSIYASFQRRLLGFRMSELLAVYARSMACALAAGMPLILATLAGTAMPGLLTLALLCVSGVLCWMAALRLLRHPAWEEVRLVIVAVVPLARPQPAK